ncbi:CRISP/Allergen/PR-1 like protein [Argiope bruennichi]|uniref:CRISP/Allergen/PR-1 like protein n=1 Tax=Argiope bruennichi TaxID=94029 RepID=A0A8T0E3Q9_ARGBR|nr:CRISP/Allergen/PR-1 like protein [Argiope bruennichi]
MAHQMKVAVFLVFIAVVACDACKYLKFSPIHSYCLPPNPTCKLLDTTVTDADKALVVRLHNEYREKVATGRETEAGGLPTAANMMEMVWDDELAAVAQKHAEQCKFQHDCYKCRQVDRFQVGQNIYMGFTYSMPSDSSWETMVKAFYDEVKQFKKEYIKPFVFGSYGHFTQVVWATSWRVGCGRSVFKEGEWYRTFLVCNYGPAGNMMGGEMYKAGPPCSACPSGTCCGSSCGSNYRGLCKPFKENSLD